MCLGVPGRLLSVDGGDGLAQGMVEFAGVQRRVCLACVPDASPGDYVIVHAGIAISRVDAEEAARIFTYLQEAGENDGWVETGGGP